MALLFKTTSPWALSQLRRLVTTCCFPLTPSQVCSHKQKLFRIHTSWKPRYQHPGCWHEIWECQLTSGAWPGHPALYWALLRLTLLRTPEWGFQPACIPSAACCLLGSPAPWGQTGRSKWPLLAVDNAELFTHRVVLAPLRCRIVQGARICRRLILWRAEAFIKHNNNYGILSPGWLPWGCCDATQSLVGIPQGPTAHWSFEEHEHLVTRTPAGQTCLLP